MSNNPSQPTKTPESEDDLDDLDDYLDEFQDEILNQKFDDTPKPQENITKPEIAGDSTQKDPLEDILKQLENDSPDSKEMFEKLLKDLTNLEQSNSPDSQKNATTSNKTPDTLKDTISSTLNRLKESGPKVDQEIKDEEPTKLLSDLLNQLSLDNEGNAGEGGDLDFTNLLTELLDQLASKAVLYEPLKDLSVKYPKWIEENKDSITDEERVKYQKQSDIVTAIITKFEDPEYDEKNKEHKEYIADKLEEMQNSGNPPKELMGDLEKTGIPGFQFDEGDIPDDLDKDIEKDLEQNCQQQ